MKSKEETHSNSQGWHVLYTYANFEKKVHDALQIQKIETYLPLLKVEKKWSDRMKISEKPLFPNYIFIRPNAGKFNYSSLSVKGAVKFIKIGNKPCIVQDSEIILIQKLLSITTDISHESTYKKGDQVKVLDGPFEGFYGTVRELSGTSKLYIHIELLNQTISVKILNANLQRIAS
ncbi:transcription termination/antitermination protein NusG [Mucilaginibacter sp. SJ]|uniref:transcription termination/antitermination protein NusG n=1 Tax=Mucilaginibacter sp. SJ TaxID=3029053 RepID=UPI0023A9C1D7|nr:UpxY family transcription antiterminator [Mucilaginibacter sp. SJ]WEA01618.1 UpxY family transcription antiterminator [Mucilaginibacter sp. SJ]